MTIERWKEERFHSQTGSYTMRIDQDGTPTWTVTGPCRRPTRARPWPGGGFRTRRDCYVLPEGEPLIPGKPKVGWMTYLRAERLAEVPARIPCKSVELDGQGTIFIVTDEHQFSAHNPDDVARALALTEFLERHKALRVIPLNVPM